MGEKLDEIKNQILTSVLVPFVVEFLKSIITEENIKRLIDKGIDALEDHIEESETKIDDKILPVIDAVREALGVPDND